MNQRIAQVEIIVFKIINNKPLFLLLKRIPERGGFWQPVTGGVHEGENLDTAAKRELFEETQITEFNNFLKDVYFFEFGSDDEGWMKEYVYGVGVNQAVDAILSFEHSEKNGEP